MWVSETNPPVRRVQIVLLLVLTTFVGAMWGLERTTIPLIAEDEFGITSSAVTLSFVAGFGVTKAFANLVAGGLMDRIGRRRVLLLGWLIGVPVPLLIVWAPSWEWVIVANLLLGANQGLVWTATIMMMMDHFDPRRRGLSTGLVEFVGYTGVAGLTFATGFLATTLSPRQIPFLIGLALAVVGVIVSLVFVRETMQRVQAEVSTHAKPSFRQAFADAARDRTLQSCAQAGLVTKINDAAVWGLLPLFLASQGVGIVQIAIVAAVYPQVWGVGQLASGPLGDRIGRKPLIVWGLLLQALGIWALAASGGMIERVAGAAILGAGTAAVYPTLIAAVGDRSHPLARASAVGVFRWYRDAGFVVGALVAGGFADLVGFRMAYVIVGSISIASALFVAIRMASREILWADLHRASTADDAPPH